ncbi:MAG: serine O-acetyltransferase [Candidatus Latescibacterota bacterium]
MKFTEYRLLVLSDLYRVTGNIRLKSLLRQIFLGESFKYIFWMRTCRFTRENLFLRFTIYHFLAHRLLKRYRYKFGIAIGYTTDIGSGFYIGNFGNIVVNGKAKIGKNCYISQGVTIGQTNRGNYEGIPTIGDGVYIGSGAKVIGSVKIGNNVAIGANCVVTKDIPDNAVVVGIPGRVISFKGAADYIHRIDYEDKIHVKEYRNDRVEEESQALA